MILDLIVGCRPNFVKAAALIEAAKRRPNIQVRLIHTGQHTSIMSDPFFKELNLPEPAWTIRPGNQSPSERIGNMIGCLGSWWDGDPKPDYVMVVGDTDSTLAGAVAAKKSRLRLVHVEAGLRCGDDNMQEEINRKMIDSVADVLYTSTTGACENLVDEGQPYRKIKFVGNVMVDTLYNRIDEAKRKFPRIMEGEYAMLTLHRAENVDTTAKMNEIIAAVGEVSKHIPVVFPRHPRGHVRLYAAGLAMTPPMSYLEFIAAMSRATFVMTDSGGVQEETTALKVPCVTIRPNTERPETVHFGTNNIAGTDALGIIKAATSARYQDFDLSRCDKMPELWDGYAAKRIMEDLENR